MATDIMYGSGINRMAELVDSAEAQGIVETKGAWYSWGGEKLGQGRDKTMAIPVTARRHRAGTSCAKRSGCCSATRRRRRVTTRSSSTARCDLDIRRKRPIKRDAEILGNNVRVKVVENKLAPPFREATFDIMKNVATSEEAVALLYDDYIHGGPGRARQLVAKALTGLDPAEPDFEANANGIWIPAGRGHFAARGSTASLARSSRMRS